ncbi:MAG: hypothetical protein H0V81_13570, partial [Solirubrobacterales bacterium]|nr:hypothetical protein [Solirubrobacterales bacterium]
APPGAAEFRALAQKVLERDGAAARLLPAADGSFSGLQQTLPYERPFAQGLLDTARAVAAQSDAVRATLDEAPAALNAATTGLAGGRSLLTAVRTFSTNAQTTLADAPSGLRDLSLLLGEARRPLQRLEPTVREILPPTLSSVTSALQATRPVVGRVKGGVDTARPILGTVGRYGCDLANAGAVLRSMTGYAQTGSGVAGPAMAFRLQAVVPAGLEAVGIKDTTGLLKRQGDDPPCKYLSRAYPQFVPGSLGLRRSGR